MNDTVRRPANALTAGAIAEVLGVHPHRVHHALRTLGLREQVRAGKVRVFSDAAVSEVRRFLEQHGRPPLGSVERCTDARAEWAERR